MNDLTLKNTFNLFWLIRYPKPEKTITVTHPMEWSVFRELLDLWNEPDLNDRLVEIYNDFKKYGEMEPELEPTVWRDMINDSEAYIGEHEHYGDLIASLIGFYDWRERRARDK